MKKTLIAGGLFLTLAGCEVPVMMAAAANDSQLTGMTEITFPARLLIVAEGAEQPVYVGELRGYMSGRAEFDLVNARGETCQGEVDRSGYGETICAGVRFELTPENSPKRAMSGVQYATGALETVTLGDVTYDNVDYETAFGWGLGADDALLRQAIEENRTIEAREVRDLRG